MERKLLNLLKANDWAEFQKFLRIDVGTVSETEEAEFFKKAPENWKAEYLKSMWPSPAAEKCLMITGSAELLKLSHDNWGFFEENLRWVFEKGSDAACRRVLECLCHMPGDAVEMAMLQRKDKDLMLAWLRKFKELGDESEQLLNESLEFQNLKSVYIDYMIQQQAS